MRSMGKHERKAYVFSAPLGSHFQSGADLKNYEFTQDNIQIKIKEYSEAKLHGLETTHQFR